MEPPDPLLQGMGRSQAGGALEDVTGRVVSTLRAREPRGKIPDAAERDTRVFGRRIQRVADGDRVDPVPPMWPPVPDCNLGGPFPPGPFEIHYIELQKYL